MNVEWIGSGDRRVLAPIFSRVGDLMQRSDLSEDLQDLASLARDIAESKIAPLIPKTEESATFNPEIKQILGAAGFFGLVVPEEYGGVQSDIGHQCIVLEEIARVYPSACTYLTAHWLATKLIALHATGDQRSRLGTSTAAGRGDR